LLLSPDLRDGCCQLPDVAEPVDGDPPEVRAAWEAARREAYCAEEAKRQAWLGEYGHLPTAETPPENDEPFCGELGEHDCGGATCSRRPTARNIGFPGDVQADDGTPI
jgi:hypothetical protein